MSKLIVDADLRKRMPQLLETILFEDEEGKLIGRFVPEAEYHKLLYAYLAKTCPVSDQELDRIAASPGEKPNDSVLQLLRSL